MLGFGDRPGSIERARELIPPPERPAEEHLRQGCATELRPG